MRSLLYVVVLSAVAPGLAAAKGKAKGGELVAIAVTATGEQEAKDRMTRMVELYLYARILGYDGVPKVWAPGELPVANAKEPGTEFYVVLSVCPKKEVAARVSSIKDRVPDVITLPVTGEFPDQCLGKKAFQPMNNEEKRYVQAIVEDSQSSSKRVFYAGFLQSETRFSEATRVLEVVLQMDPENEQAKQLVQMSKMMGRF